MKKNIILVAIILLSSFGLLSLLGTSYFPMHDDTQVGRVVAMARSLKDGQFPVRWVNDLGYGFGYPLFNFYGPLPYYIGGLFYTLGIPALIATKVMMALGMIMAPIVAFLVLEPFLGNTAAAVSAILFMFAPYHAVQLYVRGAVGELYATSFIPLLFYGIVAPFYKRNRYTTVAIGSIGLSLIVLSHTILGFISFVLYGAWVGVYMIVSIFKKRNISSVLRSYGLQIGIGLCLSAFFWLPAFKEMGFTNVAGQIGGSADFRLHFVCASQLLYSPWGFGGSTAGCVDGMSFKLGIIQIVLFAYGIFLYVMNKRASLQKSYVATGGIFLTLISLFLLLPVSTFVWERLPNFSFIQYPWRFLSFAAFGIAVVGGLSVANSQSLMRRIFAVLIIGLVILANKDEFRPQMVIERPMRDYETTKELRSRVSSVSDEYLPKEIIRPYTISQGANAIVDANGKIVLERTVEKSNYIQIVLSSDAAQPVRILKAWFPGWRYFVNGIEVDPIVKNGFANVTVLRGASVIELRLFDTPVRRFSNTLSVITVCICALLYIRYEKNNA